MYKFTTIILFTVFTFAYDISTSKTVTQKVTPNVLLTHINVTVEKKDLNDLINSTSKIVKKAKNFCQNVNYNFSPRYVYINKEKIFKGYVSSINAKCTFPEEKIKNFTQLINSFSNEAKVSLTSIRYTLTKVQKQKALKDLKIKALKEAEYDAKTLSKKLNMECFITNTSLAHNITPPRRAYPMSKSMRIMSTPLEVPKSDNTYKLTIRYSIKCY